MPEYIAYRSAIEFPQSLHFSSILPQIKKEIQCIINSLGSKRHTHKRCAHGFQSSLSVCVHYLDQTNLERKDSNHKTAAQLPLSMVRQYVLLC
jgi:hypothetical protein